LMAFDGDRLLADFAATVAAIGGEPPPLRYEHLPAPHRARGLPCRLDTELLAGATRASLGCFKGDCPGL
jgi:hypothetical protein